MKKEDFEAAEKLLENIKNITPYLKCLSQEDQIHGIALEVMAMVSNSSGGKYQVIRQLKISKGGIPDLGKISKEGQDRIRYILTTTTQFIRQVYVEELAKLEKQFEKLGSNEEN